MVLFAPLLLFSFLTHLAFYLFICLILSFIPIIMKRSELIAKRRESNRLLAALGKPAYNAEVKAVKAKAKAEAKKGKSPTTTK